MVLCQGEKGKECKIHALFNFPSEIIGIYCEKHALDGMINIVDKKCQEFGCNTRPIFNIPGSKTGILCARHAKRDMIDVVNKKCEETGCVKQPCFNYPIHKTGVYCFQHAKKGMVNVVSKKCIEPDCNTRPTYNVVGEPPIYCVLHKKDDMIDVGHTLCIKDGCMLRPHYNLKGLTPIYCVGHKLEDMIDVTNKRCLGTDTESCDLQPTYGIKNMPAQYCVKHALKGMIDVKHKVCCESTCITRPSFNIIGEKTPIRCAKHKLTGMVDTSKPILKCIHKTCLNQPTHNIKDKRAIYCEEHISESNMINVLGKCSKCKKNSVYINNKIKYCIDHIDEKTKAQIKKLCKYCDNNEYATHVCKECCINKHKKEYNVVQYLKKNLCNKFIYDKNEPVKECSKRRPDIFFDLDTHVIIVEIDENQHKSYDEQCECARMNEIVNSLGGLPVVFIRYNPDKSYNKKKEMCFDSNDKLNLLKSTIETEINKIPKSFEVKLIQLYFDDNNKKYNPYKEELITSKISI
jgi:hypothetical protein